MGRLVGVGSLTVMLAAALAGCGGGGGGAIATTCPPGQRLIGTSCQPIQPQCDVPCGQGCCPEAQVCISAATGVCAAPVTCSTDAQCADGKFCHQGACVETRQCIFRPPPGRFEPRVAWQWTGSTTLPDYNSVISTPVVIPLARASDAFAPPAVVFNSTQEFTGGGEEEPAVMRAVDGRDGHDLWTTDLEHRVNGLSAIAAGDLDGDGSTEFVTGRFVGAGDGAAVPPAEQGLVAFGSRGQFLWERKGIVVHWGAPSIANLFGTRESQVIMGATVLDARGNVLCRGHLGSGDKFLGPISVVADVDLDGKPDLVAGSTVYDLGSCPQTPPAGGPATLAVKPGWPARDGVVQARDGLVAVADLVGDAHPEIVIVVLRNSVLRAPNRRDNWGAVRVYDHQGNVLFDYWDLPGSEADEAQRTSAAPGGAGGAPTIADFDGDGLREIGVAGASRYTVLKPFLNRAGATSARPVLWSRATQDDSEVTGSSVFDFENDGKAEVVYGDECFTRVYDGTDGEILFESPNPSCTVHESPVIADVDRDGRAEVVVATNDLCTKTCAAWAGSPQVDPEKLAALGGRAPGHRDAAALGVNQHGVTVFKDLRDRWVSTRPVWNQHAYSVTNIRTDGSVPFPVESNWRVEGLNNFRMNTIEDPDYSAPDVTVAPGDPALDRSRCGEAMLRVRVRVANRGTTLVARGVPVAVYRGGPTGEPIAIVRTTEPILPGRSIAVEVDIPAPAERSPVTVVADADEQGLGVAGECDETNNAVVIPGAFCAPPGG